MSIKKREVAFASEVDDVAIFLVHIVRDIKAGKSISEVAAGNLTELFDAVTGVNEIGDELAKDRGVVLQTIGYRTGELTDALLSPPVIQP